MHIWNVTSIVFLLLLGLLDVWHHALFTFLKVHLFPFMWAYRHHFHIEDADDGRLTHDCGVKVEFNQSGRARHCDENLIKGKLSYIGKIQETMQVDLSSFQCVNFRCKWWDSFDWNNVKEDHDSGLVCINSKKILAKRSSLIFSQNTTTKCFLPRCVR